MASDGTDLRILFTSDNLISTPAVSPDGRAIAYVELSPSNGGDLTLAKSDGSGRHALAMSPAIDGFPSWAPDGQRLVFQSNRSGTEDLWVTTVDGSQIIQLTFDSVGLEHTPSWSAQDSLIAFGEFNSDSGPGIHIISPTGLGERRVYSGTSERPTWSPDGTHLAVSQNTLTSSREDLIVIAVANGVADTVTNDASRDTYPFWSPDGQSLLFLRDSVTGSPSCVGVLALGGSGFACLIQDSVVGSPLFWTP